MARNIFPEDRLGNLSLNDFLNMSDIASAARQMDEVVERELNLDQKKDELKRRLLDAANARGEKLTPAQAEIAVDNFFDGLYSFKEPKKGFETTLAGLYVDRARIGKFYGIPVLAATLIAGVIYTGSSIASSAHRHSLERGVETSVETFYKQRQSLLGEIEIVSSSPTRTKLSPSDQDVVKRDLEAARRDLEDIDRFLTEFCPQGNSQERVTQDNYNDVNKRLESVSGQLSDSKKQLDEGKDLLQKQEKITQIRTSLDSLISEVKGVKPIPVFLERAQTAYNSGVSSLERKQVNEAEVYVSELERTKRDIGEFSGLSARLEKVYGDIRNIAKEENAKTRAERLYQDALQSVQSANVPRLTETSRQLEELDEKLNQEYTIRIVNRKGILTGVERDYTRHYVALEAVDSSGNPVLVNVANEESGGKVERVSMWAQRVTDKGNNSRWEKVKRDKQDNNVIDDYIAGYKKKGYLEKDMAMDGFLDGTITHWENTIRGRR